VQHPRGFVPGTPAEEAVVGKPKTDGRTAIRTATRLPSDMRIRGSTLARIEAQLFPRQHALAIHTRNRPHRRGPVGNFPAKEFDDPTGCGIALEQIQSVVGR
jgi:hypothetical protein